MKRHFFALFVSFLITPGTYAQGVAFSSGHRSDDSLRVTNFSLGLIHHTDSLQGLQMNAISNIAQSMTGMQMSALSNVAATPFRGLQLSGISNIAMGVERGTQLSGVLNVSSGYMRGLQMGSYNYADSLNGSQVGLINVALAHPRGWQVGIINYTHDTIAHKIGLVNVNPLTDIDLMVYVGTASKFSTALRFRNRSTYNIIGVGTHYMGLDERFSGSLQYRIGQFFSLPGERWSLSGDLGFSHIETFEQRSQNSPERLFALEARLNADYQVTPYLGAFVSVGYTDSRHYHHARHYRSRPLIEGGLTWRVRKETHPQPLTVRERLRVDELCSGMGSGMTCRGMHSERQDCLLSSQQDGAGGWSPFLTAGLEVTGINAFVHLFDRFVLDADYAQTTMHTWRRNFSHGFVWDNDQFSTNLFAHPYHGNLYFNAARSSGLNFWQSAPFAMGGSLMWEFLGEIEPPAVNDLIATTMGGICIGEIAHRISDLLIDNRSQGFSRFVREAAAMLVNPMKGLNRIISGEAWQLSPQRGTPGHGPLDFSLSVGDRYLADDGALFRGEHNPYVNLYMEYGEPLNQEGANRPYDFFDAELTFGLSGTQPLVNSLNLLGRLWSTPMIEGQRFNAEFGFYQHFNYYDSRPVKDGTSLTPYRISEAAAAGPGLIMQMPEVGTLTKLEQRVFLSGILLGGTKSDYYNVIDRDYNMGSGFSVKSKTHMELRHFGRFILKASYFRLFTWKGYEKKDLNTINPLYLNAQGDRGNASLLVINPMTEFDLTPKLSLVGAASYFIRNTHYKYYPNIKARTFEIRAGLTWHP